jgi:hypothetical protein
MSLLQRSWGISGPMELSPSSADDFRCLLESLEAITATELRIEDTNWCSSVGFIQEWRIDGVDDEGWQSASCPDFRNVTFRITFGKGIAERLGSDDARTLIGRAVALAALGESGVVVCHVAEIGLNGQIPLPERH